jgi:hypothetical protein
MPIFLIDHDPIHDKLCCTVDCGSYVDAVLWSIRSICHDIERRYPKGHLNLNLQHQLPFLEEVPGFDRAPATRPILSYLVSCNAHSLDFRFSESFRV